MSETVAGFAETPGTCRTVFTGIKVEKERNEQKEGVWGGPVDTRERMGGP